MLIIQHLSVDGGYQAIRKSEHMTRQILMFSFSVLPNYRWDFCQPEQCTDITAGELHRGKGERRLSGLPGLGYPALPCQTRCPQPPGSPRGAARASGEREASGLGQGSPLLHKHTWILGEMVPVPIGGGEQVVGGRQLRRAKDSESSSYTPTTGYVYIPLPAPGEPQTPVPRPGLDHGAPA